VRLITLGQVLKPRGLKGDLKVLSLASAPGRFKELGHVIFEKDGRQETLSIERASFSGRHVFIRFKDVDTLEAAERLRDGYLKIPEADLKALPENTYYQFELVGFAVMTDTGERLGRVREVADYPSCDALAVTADNGREVLVPMVGDIVKNVDKNKKEIALFAGPAKELF
jgi:16S rRNA processing protein RimM